MGDIGKPERIVEDEPISWPDEEPLTVPAPEPAEPVPAGARAGASASTISRGSPGPFAPVPPGVDSSAARGR
ncbi:hypothetical protein I6A84_43700 [Frankia sp. CNm7]|uniref:Uncharacterized protein n=1 Tax=Frankia nepalensis TaxID=1836974 RepID=A0A937RFL6_9ACTN|nr:hypothetical protein [Frankia nepalensis]MBL7494809.1 hypothetical protein [Frankia nepalensis]MBL7514106.1 hypothetical protein [Frankia nepalensis]MBL7524767.1 hypothetical protein [Frankia nepalensis]MBL7626514.1 hypothetical protein [Frankia nepalensis]